MNKQDLLSLNVVPEGKAPWLNYAQYQTLKQLFDAVSLPYDINTNDQTYLDLRRFLIDVAGLAVPLNEIDNTLQRIYPD